MQRMLLIVLLALLLPAHLIFAERAAAPGKVAVLPGIMAPAGILADGEQIYIYESAVIYVFSASDYRFIKKFGRKGEGPGEFKLDDDNQVDIALMRDRLLINSVGRISYFSKDGTFISERKNDSGRWLGPLGKSFVGMKRVYDDKKTRTRKVCLFNAELELIKILYGETDGIQPRLKKIDVITWPSSAIYDTDGDTLVVCDKRKNHLYVFNEKGEKIHDFKLEEEPVKMTADLKKRYVKFYREEDPYWRERWERLKSWYVFPDELPVLWYLRMADDKIYIVTYKTKNQKQEVLVLDVEGKLLKRVFLPLARWDIMGLMPFTVCNDRLYQLVENEDTEDWELYIYEIEGGEG